jgi:hypothetical protein
VDGREKVGNNMGRAPLGRMESSVGKERDGSDDMVDIAWGERCGSDYRVDGGETVGNSLGRALLGRSDSEATTRWTDGKPWEIAWGELQVWMRREGGRKGNGGK